MKYIRYIPVVALILIAAATRLIDHPFNFTAVGAMALFAGANVRDRRLAFLLPMLTMLATDFIIGFHNVMIPVYACFAFTVLLGVLVGEKQNLWRIGAASVTSSVIFFLVTNLPFWFGTRYPYTLEGAMTSYTAALPFFRNELAGDLFYNAVLFGTFALVKMRFPVLAEKKIR